MRVIELLSRIFPPFTKAVKVLVIANFGIWVVCSLLDLLFSSFTAQVIQIFGLVPRDVMHGQIWQLFTYAFLHGNFSHFFGNMIGLWMFGYMLEQDWGYRRFMGFYFFAAIGAAVVTTLLSFTRLFGLSPDIPTIGASGGVFGILMGAALIHGKQIMLFNFIFPIQIRIKVLIYGIMQIMGLLSGAQGVAYAAHLSGMLFAWIHIRYIGKRGMIGMLHLGNSISLGTKYRHWITQRNRKKFEKYMQKHDPHWRLPEDRDKP